MLTLALALLLSTNPTPAQPPVARTTPSPTLLTKLRRGVNLSHWWCKPPDIPEGRIERLIADADIALIKSSGITHVRIPIDPVVIADGKDRLNQGRMMALTGAVHKFNTSGIATVIDLHTDGPMHPAKNPEGWEKELTTFWVMFAPAWKNTQPDMLAVELLNEPNGLKDDKEWPAAQERLRSVVRNALPKHPIILTGDDWSGIDPLIKLEPSPDTNVLYTFHFYDPHAFTHQQAAWGSPMWKDIKGLRYPFDKANTDEVLARIDKDAKAANSVRWYAKEKWNTAAIDARFAKAKAWADKHRATLYLGEFGAYRAGCDEASLNAWLQDVRRAAEKNNIGWCAWDYTGGFAITTKPDPKSPRTLEETTAKALGLTTPVRRR